ncbi:MAG: prolipoprotein diacylglyceryl transferase [Polyangiaceae bacterium]
MIPYVIVPPLRLGPLTLQPFGLLVAIGVGIGWAIVVKRGKALGFVDANVQSFLWWMCTGGFIGGHVFDAILYHPDEVLQNPLKLVMLWAGLSSFGGFAGATLGGLAWKYLRIEPLRSTGLLGFVPIFKRREVPMPLLPYADLMIAAFPISWIFGRTGCSIVHDHPGALANHHALAVAYGPGPIVDHGWFLLRYGSTPRYDLGLLELMVTLFIALGFVLAWKRGGARGYFLVAASLIYAPIRFGLDFLRATDSEGGDPRYAGFTPAQWACVALAVYGLWLLRFIRSRPPITP